MLRMRTLLRSQARSHCSCRSIGAASAVGSLSPKEELGKAIFFDENLSLNQNQSCASCHDPDFGFTGLARVDQRTRGRSTRARTRSTSGTASRPRVRTPQ